MQRLIAARLNDCEIAKRTGVPRATAKVWRCSPPVRLRGLRDTPCGATHDYTALPVKAYSCLLGLYLGDGCISRMGRVWRLRISLDKKYPGIIDCCRHAIDTVMPGQRGSVEPQQKGCVVVSLYSKHWPCLFPQHGPGRKHTRQIRLEPWQQELVDRATEDFIRGLIHSDGCRVVADDRGVKSIRYHFTNHWRRHRRPVHRRARPPRHPLDTIDQVRRLGLRQGRHRASRRVHRPEVLTVTHR